MIISILSGSARAKSSTSRVAVAIERFLMEKHIEAEKIHMVDFNGFDISGFNEKGPDFDNLTNWQQHLVNCVSPSSLVFIISPEYNWFPSAEIMQYIHRMSDKKFSALWDNKFFALAGVSNGRGGRIPAIQLSYVVSKIINVFNYDSMVGSKIFESQFTPQVLDENGRSLGNEIYDKGVGDFVAASVKGAMRWHKV